MFGYCYGPQFLVEMKSKPTQSEARLAFPPVFSTLTDILMNGSKSRYVPSTELKEGQSRNGSFEGGCVLLGPLPKDPIS